jgi:hypothetical protein
MREGMTVIYLGDGATFDASDPRNATHKSCEGLNDGEKIDTQVYTFTYLNRYTGLSAVLYAEDIRGEAISLQKISGTAIIKIDF